jgi:2-(1,2-epoxy-1,2-dihydrophenyl)acetyl-CoA isomerase
MPKPVVAAINGACVGAGLGLALACDIRVAADTAQFGTAFTAIGLTCDSGLSATLARAVGAARASELVLLGELFSAAQAANSGIAGRVIDPADVLIVATELATRLAAGPTRAYAESKRALAESWQRSLPEILRAEGDAQTRLGLATDHQNAVSQREAGVSRELRRQRARPRDGQTRRLRQQTVEVRSSSSAGATLHHSHHRHHRSVG